MPPSRPHDRALLDALEAAGSGPFDGPAWRVTTAARDPLQPSAAGGRWSPPGAFEVLYTSLTQEGALAEIFTRLSLEPVWPSRLRHNLHRLAVRTCATLRFADIAALAQLGVDAARYASFDYTVTQSIAAAAHFLGFDGLLVPSARWPVQNLVLFTERLAVDARVSVELSEPVDWTGWRASRSTTEAR